MSPNYWPPGFWPSEAQQQSGNGGTPAPTPETTPVGSGRAKYEIQVDWDGDGDFDEDFEDVTRDVLNMTWRRGRNRASQLVGRSTAGRAQFFMRSEGGKFFPFGATGDLAGQILPARDVRVLMTVPADPIAQFTRPSKASYIGRDNLPHRADDDELRNSHYRNGERHILLEGAGVNRLSDLNPKGWFSAVGSLATTVLDDVNGFTPATFSGTEGSYREDRHITLEGDSPKAFSICVKEGTSSETVVQLRLGNTVRMQATIGPWTDGEPDVSASTGEVIDKIELADGWWIVRVRSESFDAQGIGTYRVRFYPNGTGSGTGQGDVSVLACQLEDNELPTSFMDPDDGGREVDSVYFPFGYRPQATTIYLKVLAGASGLVTSPRLLQISGSSGDDPKFQILRTSTGYKVVHDTGSSAVESEVSELPDFDDEFELRVVLFSDGAVQIHFTDPDDNTTSGAKSGALDLEDSWSARRLWLNGVSDSDTGFAAFQAVRVVTGEATLDDLRNREVEDDVTSSTIVLLTYVMWHGQLDEIRPVPHYHGHHRVRLTALGPLRLLTEREVNLPLVEDTPSGGIVSQILDESGWPSGRRRIDDGQTILDTFFTSGRVSAFRALQQVEDTEFGWVGETRDGGIFFEDRHHRLSGHRADSQVTFKDAAEGGVLRIMEPSQYDYLHDVYNRVRVPYRIYREEALATLWRHPDTLGASTALSIPRGESLEVWAPYPGEGSPGDHIGVHTWTTPVASTDYVGNSIASGNGQDRTSDLAVTVSKFPEAMKITIENTGSGQVFLTTLQARGTPLVRSDTVPVIREDDDSQQKFGVRDFPFPGEFIPSALEAQDFAHAVLAIYSDPVPAVKILWLASRNALHLAMAGHLDLSDRVTVSLSDASDLGIDEEMFIESESHKVDMGGARHTVVYEFSLASDFLTGFWRLGVSALGTDTRLGY